MRSYTQFSERKTMAKDNKGQFGQQQKQGQSQHPQQQKQGQSQQQGQQKQGQPQQQGQKPGFGQQGKFDQNKQAGNQGGKFNYGDKE
jgi:transcription termination factor Rho